MVHKELTILRHSQGAIGDLSGEWSARWSMASLVAVIHRHRRDFLLEWSPNYVRKHGINAPVGGR